MTTIPFSELGEDFIAYGYPEDHEDLDFVTEAEFDGADWDLHSADLNEMDEFDIDEWAANVCCPDSISAARSFCGCGGSGQLPRWVERNYELNADI